MSDRYRDRFPPMRKKAYRAWERMRDRCNNPNAKGYEHYGLRGIRVCSDWDSFWCFWNELGDPPSEIHSLDRINVNRGYEPGNVRWATQHEQNRNRRDNIFASIDGVMLCLKDAAEARSINYGTVKGRLSRGWDLDRALNAPLSPPGRPRPKKSKICNPPFNR